MADSETLCTFTVKSKYDKDGKKLSKPRARSCGKPAAAYDCSGELSSIRMTLRMTLCDNHRDFIVVNYKWTVKPVIK